MSATTGRGSHGELDIAGLLVPRLRRRIHEAGQRARRLGEPVLASACASSAFAIDPSAVVATSRLPDEDWFCLEQPAREGSAVAALGSVALIEAGGPARFSRCAAAWRALTEKAVADDPSGPPGAGLAAFGGFAFAPAGCITPHWRGFGAGSLRVPQISLARRGDGSWVTANAMVAPDDDADDLARQLRSRLERLRSRSLPLHDPPLVGDFEVVSAMPPAHFEEAVRRAVQRIASAEFEKVVLAREVDVNAPRPHDPAAVLGLLREAFPTSFVFAVGRGEATFIGATPELLVRRQGQRASTVALAGSTRRSADPAVDDHLGEQLLRSDKNRSENAIVARRIARALRPHAVWVTSPEEPVVVKVANIQHLAAPIRAQLAAPIDAVTLAGILHPTPAVGAEPAAALEAIPALEGFDRGWYAGPVGWVDRAGDGEFCVALRCALLRGALGRCYAGCGIVLDSDPAAELAETEIKLGVMLPALAG